MFIVYEHSLAYLTDENEKKFVEVIKVVDNWLLIVINLLQFTVAIIYVQRRTV